MRRGGYGHLNCERRHGVLGYGSLNPFLLCYNEWTQNLLLFKKVVGSNDFAEFDMNRVP
jgi:hypothetical protein